MLRENLPVAGANAAGKTGWNWQRNSYQKPQGRGEWVSPNLTAQMNFFEVHHIIPLHLGGNSSLDNLIVLCKRCHLNAHAEIRVFEKLRTRNETTLDMYGLNGGRGRSVATDPTPDGEML